MRNANSAIERWIEMTTTPLLISTREPRPRNRAAAPHGRDSQADERRTAVAWRRGDRRGRARLERPARSARFAIRFQHDRDSRDREFVRRKIGEQHLGSLSAARAAAFAGSRATYLLERDLGRHRFAGRRSCALCRRSPCTSGIGRRFAMTGVSPRNRSAASV